MNLSVYRRIFRKPVGTSPQQLDRLRSELESALRLQKQLADDGVGALRLLGDLQEDDDCYFVEHQAAVALLPENLFDPNLPLLPLAELVEIVLGAARALLVAHKRKPTAAIHGGICPATLLRDLDGDVRLADFGVAPAYCRAIGNDPYSSLAISTPQPSQATRGSAIWEVVDWADTKRDDRLHAFIAPEKFAHNALATFSRESDAYALGVLAYLLAERRHPYVAPDETSDNPHRFHWFRDGLVLEKARPMRRAPWLTTASAVAERVRSLTEQLVRNAPGGRPPLDDVVAALSALVPNRPPPRREPPPREDRAKPPTAPESTKTSKDVERGTPPARSALPPESFVPGPKDASRPASADITPNVSTPPAAAGPSAPTDSEEKHSSAPPTGISPKEPAKPPSRKPRSKDAKVNGAKVPTEQPAAPSPVAEPPPPPKQPEKAERLPETAAVSAETSNEQSIVPPAMPPPTDPATAPAPPAGKKSSQPVRHSGLVLWSGLALALLTLGGGGVIYMNCLGPTPIAKKNANVNDNTGRNGNEEEVRDSNLNVNEAPVDNKNQAVLISNGNNAQDESGSLNANERLVEIGADNANVNENRAVIDDADANMNAVVVDENDNATSISNENEPLDDAPPPELASIEAFLAGYRNWMDASPAERVEFGELLNRHYGRLDQLVALRHEVSGWPVDPSLQALPTAIQLTLQGNRRIDFGLVRLETSAGTTWAYVQLSESQDYTSVSDTIRRECDSMDRRLCRSAWEYSVLRQDEWHALARMAAQMTQSPSPAARAFAESVLWGNREWCLAIDAVPADEALMVAGGVTVDLSTGPQNVPQLRNSAEEWLANPLVQPVPAPADIEAPALRRIIRIFPVPDSAE